MSILSRPRPTFAPRPEILAKPRKVRRLDPVTPVDCPDDPEPEEATRRARRKPPAPTIADAVGAVEVFLAYVDQHFPGGEVGPHYPSDETWDRVGKLERAAMAAVWAAVPGAGGGTSPILIRTRAGLALIQARSTSVSDRLAFGVVKLLDAQVVEV